jgi:hypothetical protein
MKPISFAAALRDVNLLGASFAADSWKSWHVVAKIISGEKLTDDDMVLVRECTGRTVLPTKPRRLYLLCGRRSGKSRFMSALAVWSAALSADWKRRLAPGESGVVMLVGADRRQARVLSQYCDGLLQTRLLKSLVKRRTAERIELKSGAVLEIVTNDARTIRGRSALALCGDEVAFWRADGESASSDVEVLAAATPALMTAPNGGLLVLSSTTYRRKGVMWDRYREFYGSDDSEELVWLAPSMLMNTSLPAAEVEREIAADPVKNKAEYLSTWRDDLSGYIPASALEAATDFGVTQRLWTGKYTEKYCAFVDGAAGASEGNDSFTMAICRGGADGVIHLERLIEFEPPFDPSRVVAELVLILRSYNLSLVHGDAHGWAASEFARHGITYRKAAPKSELYIATLPLLLSSRLRLLDNAKLRRQFASLERSVGAGGRERIEEPLRSGFHDDLCNVVAGAAVTLSEMLARQPLATYANIGAFTAPRSGIPGGAPGYGGTAEDIAYMAAGSRFGSRGNGGSVPG